jgi:hypothetical protein
MAEIFMRTMRSGKTGERPSLDDAGKTMAFRDTGDIDQITDFEQIGCFDFLSHFIGGDVIKAKLAQYLESALASLAHMTLFGFVDPLGLLAAEANLQCAVAILRGYFLLDDHARSGLNHSDRNYTAFSAVALRHPYFSAN